MQEHGSYGKLSSLESDATKPKKVTIMLNQLDASILHSLPEKEQNKISDVLGTIKKGDPILRADQAQLPREPEGIEIAGLIDHTLLLAQYTPTDVDRACDEALQHGFASLCVNPVYVPQIVDRLEGSKVKPASVVGFIFGAEFPQIKVAQADALIDAGIAELDAVLAVGLLKSGHYQQVGEDLRALVEACHQADVLFKVILETGLLTKEEKIAGTIITKHVGADYVKTCTGFAPGEATVEDIQLLRKIAGNEMGVKAAAGIRSYEKAISLVRAGASRLGATQSVKISEEAGALT
jgi:deoxyribose-phosphate aldolase